MSSQSASRRAHRTRQSATPKQTNGPSQSISSSPIAGSGADHQLLSEASEASQRSSTPRIRTNANQQRAPDSSPILFRSSPVAERLQSGGPNRSSPQRQGPMTDGNRTPKAHGGNLGESSPIRYASSSLAGNLRSDNLASSSSALFVQSAAGELPPSSARQRRHDVQSDLLTSGSGQRRRIFVDENGVAIGNGDSQSDANTFSNLDPTTSDAEILGGNTNRIVWGTNISIADCRHACHDFLMNFQKKYRMAMDGEINERAHLLTEHPGHTKEYLEMMKTMLDLGVTALNLDIRNLKAYPPTRKLWHQLIGFPSDIIPIIDLCIKDCMLELAYEKGQHEERRIRHLQRNAGTIAHGRSANTISSEINGNDSVQRDGAITREAEPKSELEKEVLEKIYRVRPFGLDSSINLRELNPSDMDKLVSIKGLIIRTTPVIPDMKDAFFRCSVCNHCVQVDIDRGKIAEPAKCPRVACESVNSMQIVHNRSGFADKQVIKLQETPDSIPDGQTPHSVSVCAYDDLVDVCKAGDRVEITGIFKCNQVRINPRQRTVKNIFKTYVDALHVQKVDRQRLGVDVSTIEEELSDQVVGDIEQARKFTEAEEKKIKETAERNDIYELLSRSLAPSIYEMEDVKKGILLQLFGGTNKSFQKGGNPKYRGDINVLLCGDPSTSKSQILQYVHKIAPRGVYTSGKGSSAVGLTAYVTRDPETRQLVLESGALVLSDGGVCCIDEFDKMSDSTRSVLHEVMEQQTVSIAKAGIITTLNARTSILASANPIGSKYNPKIPVPQNIDLPPTLLSRFDLVYLVLDRVDEQNDRRLARHLLGMYLEDTPENASREEILPIEFLTSYISYARANISPVLTSEASSALVEAYVAMRGLGADVRAAERRITATTRQLESMIRLAEAHAKMRLSQTVSSADVAEAVRLIQSALKQAATDSRTGLIDMGLLTEGTSASERRRLADLKNAVLSSLDDFTKGGETIRVADLYKRVAERSSIPVEGLEIADVLKTLEAEGLIQVSGEGQRRTIRRLAGVV